MKPLEDIRIIAVEQYGAGPWGTVHLADLGADVIKIEDPAAKGDVGRYVPPYAEGEDSLFFETFNRNKRSLSLDLNTAEGRAVFEDLVKVSDVVYSNLRGDVPAKLKITYDDLKHINEQIVCVSLSGFGMTGPRVKEPGYDYILQGLAGWMEATGEPGGPPTKSGLSMVDFSGGYVAALTLLAAVHAARRDGVGTDCDVSLYDVAITMLNYPATWHLNRGYELERHSHSAHPSLVPFQAFQASDAWIVIGCAKEKFWQRLCDVVEHPEWVADERFIDFAAREASRNILIPMLDEVVATKTVAQWLELLMPAGIPCSPVNTMSQGLAEAHTLARGLIGEYEHPVLGTVKHTISPVRMNNFDPDYHRAPRRGEHRDAVIGELLGYDAETIEKLAQAGAFGDNPGFETKEVIEPA
jgi:crotonobetainyl-CoA:carnitine CoA-transferase CaiB-like acyl-CoA transferase